MRVLIIDDGVREQIRKVVDYAHAHVISFHDLMRVMKGQGPVPGDNPEFVLHIRMGYRCVFTIDEQLKGKMRHLSVSVSGTKWPNEHAVKELAKEFGFVRPFEEWSKWTESEARAVNILELL